MHRGFSVRCHNRMLYEHLPDPGPLGLPVLMAATRLAEGYWLEGSVFFAAPNASL
jgi:hypothetical protein